MCRRCPALRLAHQRLIFQALQAELEPIGETSRWKYKSNGGFAMGSTTDKIRGAVDTAVGKAKEKAGYAIGSEKLQAKGVVQAIKGKVETGIGKAKSGLKKGIDRI
jgi:uncharacterized protein YjbJ (UPF0337 family)